MTKQERYSDLKAGLKSLEELICLATSASGNPLMLVLFGEWASAWLGFMVRNGVVTQEQVTAMLEELQAEHEAEAEPRTEDGELALTGAELARML